MGALDASEIPPTFATSPDLVQFIIAGGPKALGAEAEASEDSSALGRAEMAKRKPTKKDIVLGIAASGRTPFTIAALEYAHSRGAETIALTCNPKSPLERAAHFAIVTDVGPEVLTGSSRMKAGTAQKMVLNMITTGAMTRLGYVYGNLMVNLRLKNSKLSERGITILQHAAHVDRPKAHQMLQSAGNDVPLALVMLKAEVPRTQAARALQTTAGHVRKAIALAQKSKRP
jgi:N-acetylmuramic acid 6-phosphate etherase